MTQNNLSGYKHMGPEHFSSVVLDCWILWTHIFFLIKSQLKFITLKKKMRAHFLSFLVYKSMK